MSLSVVLPFRPSSLAAGAFIFVFYHAANFAFQLAYYARAAPSDNALPWRAQPRRRRELLGAAALAPWGAAFAPCGCGRKPGRPAWHAALALVNTFIAALFAAATAEGFSAGRTAMTAWGAGGPPAAGGRALSAAAALLVVQATTGFLAAFTLQSVLEYVWHRAMHTRVLYAALHKTHHLNTSPTPFDDMLINPIEAAGYYVILYGPAWVLPLGLPAFALYMTALGLAGVADHAGVRLRVGPYDSSEHDLHHEKFNTNYGFPLMLMDKLCGTYSAPEPDGGRGSAEVGASLRDAAAVRETRARAAQTALRATRRAAAAPRAASATRRRRRA